MKNEKIKSENEEVKNSGKRLAVSIAVLLFVIYALFVLSNAWFNNSSLVEANNNLLRVIGLTSNDYSLYKWEGTSENDGQWVLTDGIDYTDGVPNEVRRYLVVSDTDFNNLKFTFSSANELFSYVYINDVSSNPNGATVDEANNTVTYDYKSDDNTYFDYTKKGEIDSLSSNVYTLDTKETSNATVFDIYISKDACNAFSNVSFSGNIKVG